MKKRIGLFGGTFNPVHNCHVILAQSFISELELNLLLIIPSGYSYHKTDNNKNIDNKHRYNMCQLAFKNIPNIQILTLDMQRVGNTYTHDTVTEIRGLYPDYDIWWLLGSDSFLKLDSWHRYNDLIKITSFAIALREPNTSVDIMRKNSHFDSPANIKILSTPLCPISSTQIRKGIQNQSIEPQWLPTDVETYIKENQLYERQVTYEPT